MVDVSPIPAGSRLLDEDLSAWRTGINAKLEAVTKYKTIATSKISTATYTNDPHLSGFAVVANGVYVVEQCVNFTVGAGGLDQQFVFPSGTAENTWFLYNNGTVTYTLGYQRAHSPGQASPVQVGGVVAGAGAGCTYQFGCTLFIGATGGTLDWQFKQSSSNVAATTAYKGGWVRVTRVA